ncbi:MAG: TRAP transporter small permease subunit [Saonia sp.]
MRSLADTIDALNTRLGRTLSWLTLGIVLVQFMVVLMRYVFGIGDIAAQELITYMHGFLFMLAAGYTLAVDGHVRVDVFYRTAPPRTKAWVNLLGSICLLLPMCVTVWMVSWSYVYRSWIIFEGSRESSGIQGVFLLKTAILAFAVLLGLQGISLALRSILALRGDKDAIAKLTHEQE